MTLRRLLTTAAAFVALAGAGVATAGSFPDGPGGPNIAVLNQSSLPDTVVQGKLAAFQLYADQVCEAWHCKSHLYFAAKPNDPRDWPIVVNDVSDNSGAIAYHLETNGLPEAFVSQKTAHDNGIPWTEALTHELAEMLVDPEASGTVNTANQCDPISGVCSNATFYSQEVCDPVQGMSYRLGNVRVADFVYRNWFEPDAPGPYDAGRHLKAPLSLARNSYMMLYKDGHWQSQSTFSGWRTNWDSFGTLRR